MAAEVFEEAVEAKPASSSSLIVAVVAVLKVAPLPPPPRVAAGGSGGSDVTSQARLITRAASGGSRSPAEDEGSAGADIGVGGGGEVGMRPLLEAVEASGTSKPKAVVEVGAAVF